MSDLPLEIKARRQNAVLRGSDDARLAQTWTSEGAAAAVLHGAPISTEDLDIVHRRTPENVPRLRALLDDLHAHVREIANRKLPVSQSALAGEGHVLVATELGPLDCLGTIVELALAGVGGDRCNSTASRPGAKRMQFSCATLTNRTLTLGAAITIAIRISETEGARA